MRTTVELDEDVSRAVQQLREESCLGVSQAVNELIRRGLPRAEAGPLGLRIDVSSTAAGPADLEGVETR